MNESSSMPHSTNKVTPLRRLDFLDALRGLAAIYVIAYHLIFLPSPNLGVPAWARLIAINGGAGVTLFFLISAFSLFYTMPLRMNERRPWLSYVLHRIFRIAPLFYLWIVLTVIRDHLVFQATHSWWEIAMNTSFLFNLIPTHQEGFVWASWTIGVEMLFYVIFPFIYLRVKNLGGAAALVMGSILAWMFCQVVIDYLAVPPVVSESMRQWFFPHFVPEFAMGVMAYFVIKRAMPWGDRNPELAKGLGLFLTLLAAYIYVAVLQNVGALGLPDNRYAKAICCLLVMTGLSLRTVVSLVNRLTVYLGKISYSVYLNQPTAIFLLQPIYRRIYASTSNLSLAFVGCFVLTCAVVIPMSMLTYKLVERPGIKLGKRCYGWMDRKLGFADTAVSSSTD